MRLFLTATLLATVTLTAAARPLAEPADVVRTAALAGSFKTLVNALAAADLVGPLKDDGPFTVFAPTDSAFAKLPAEALDELLKPENREKLAGVLKLHVVPGRVTARDAARAGKAESLGGGVLTFKHDGHGLRVNNARVVKADIACRNGVIHVVDAVLTPRKEKATVLGVAEKAGSFQTLTYLVKAAGLDETLGGDGPFTVFAPTDGAFKKESEALLNDLSQARNREKLRDLLKYHVVKGKLSARDLVAAGTVTTLAGKPLEVRVDQGRLAANAAKFVATDVAAENGVVHVIDGVLMPR